MPRPEPAGPAFFVVGTGRCGTNLLRQSLDAHPDFHVVRESHWIPFLHARAGREPLALSDAFEVVRRVHVPDGRSAFARIAKHSGLSARELESRVAARLGGVAETTVPGFMAAFYAEIGERNGARRVGDKTPDYGFCMTLLRDLWPDARFVHIERDGRDVAISMAHVRTFQDLVASGGVAWTELAWDRGYEAGRAAPAHAPTPERFFDLWAARLRRIRAEAEKLAPGAYLEVRFEDLLRRPQRVLRSVAHFIGEPEREPTFRHVLRRATWSLRARRRFRRDVAGKNREHPDYRALTRSRGDVLAELGFHP